MVLTACDGDYAARFVMPTFDYSSTAPSAGPVGNDGGASYVLFGGPGGYACGTIVHPIKVSISASAGPPDTSDWSSIPSYTTGGSANGFGDSYELTGIKRSYNINGSSYTFNALEQNGVTATESTTDGPPPTCCSGRPGSTLSITEDLTFYDIREVSTAQRFVPGVGQQWSAAFTRSRLSRVTETQTTPDTSASDVYLNSQSQTVSTGASSDNSETSKCNGETDTVDYLTGSGTVTVAFTDDVDLESMNCRQCSRAYTASGEISVAIDADGNPYDFDDPPHDPDTGDPLPPAGFGNLSYEAEVYQYGVSAGGDPHEGVGPCELYMCKWAGNGTIGPNDAPFSIEITRVGAALYRVDFGAGGTIDGLTCYALGGPSPEDITEIEQFPTPHELVGPGMFSGPPFGFCYGTPVEITWEPAYGGTATFTSHSLTLTPSTGSPSSYYCDT